MINEKEGIADDESIFKFLKGIPGYQLSSEELKIIESLLRLKSRKKEGTADNISFDSHLRKAKVYGALKLLESKGFVTKAPGERPAIFRLIEPKDLKMIVDRISAKTDRLLKQYDEDYARGTTGTLSPVFEKISDREQYYRRATELVSKGPFEVFILSRRGTFYKHLLNENQEKLEFDYEREWVNVICDYLLTRNGKLFSLITQQTGEDTAKLLEKKFEKRFFYDLIQRGKPYQGITCLLCSDTVLLGWNKGAPQEPTEEGLLIKSSKIYNFISILLQSKFEEWTI